MKAPFLIPVASALCLASVVVGQQLSHSAARSAVQANIGPVPTLRALIELGNATSIPANRIKSEEIAEADRQWELILEARLATQARRQPWIGKRIQGVGDVLIKQLTLDANVVTLIDRGARLALLVSTDVKTSFESGEIQAAVEAALNACTKAGRKSNDVWNFDPLGRTGGLAATGRFRWNAELPLKGHSQPERTWHDVFWFWTDGQWLVLEFSHQPDPTKTNGLAATPGQAPPSRFMTSGSGGK